jgi:dihydropyrimidine dehydrogenase (NAD+) subunit PreA
VKFPNPFVLAAAPPTDDLEMLRQGFKAGWGGAVLKTTSVEGTRVDLKYPMMTSMEYEGGRISALGNIDLISEHHIDKVEERVKALKAEFKDNVVIASIMGSKQEDWETLVARLGEAGVDMIECSFSCPQGTLGSGKPGAMLGQDPVLAGKVAGWVKTAALKAAEKRGRILPVVMKLTPHVTDFVEVAKSVTDAGADAVCVSNTIKSLMGVDLVSFIPNPNVGGKSTFSGMSGPAVKPVVLKLVADVAKKLGVSITASGGATTWSDAAEFILCGAKTVQVCTAVMHHGFDIIEDLSEGLADYLAAKGLNSVADIYGRSLPNISSHDELNYSEKVQAKVEQSLCIGCGDCFIACRDGGHQAIKTDAERKASVDIEKCVGCGLCRLVCPVKGCIGMMKKV